MDKTKIYITKASGYKQLFDENKVRRAIRRSKVTKQIEEQAVKYIWSILYPGITTTEIYQHICDFLGRSKYPHTRAFFGLKQAIMQLGPSGYPFEKFVAEVLRQHGYKAKNNVIVAGKCVEHEIDIVAEKENSHYMVECKFHNSPGTRSDIKTTLYIQARYEDLQTSWDLKNDNTMYFDQAWLVTNTKCTTDAIQYGKCIGMKVIGWNQPLTGNLRELVEDARLHPITSLITLPKDYKVILLKQGVVLCKHLFDDFDKLTANLGLSKELKDKVKEELQFVCQHK